MGNCIATTTHGVCVYICMHICVYVCMYGTCIHCMLSHKKYEQVTRLITGLCKLEMVASVNLDQLSEQTHVHMYVLNRSVVL